MSWDYLLHQSTVAQQKQREQQNYTHLPVQPGSQLHRRHMATLWLGSPSMPGLSPFLVIQCKAVVKMCLKVQKKNEKCTQASAQKHTEVTKCTVYTQKLNCTLTKSGRVTADTKLKNTDIVSLQLQSAFQFLMAGSLDIFCLLGFRAPSPQTWGGESNHQPDILYLCLRIQKCKCSICPRDIVFTQKCTFTSDTNNKDGCEYLGAKSIWFEKIMKTCLQAPRTACKHQKWPETNS